jgi:hypothetical protein
VRSIEQILLSFGLPLIYRFIEKMSWNVSWNDTKRKPQGLQKNLDPHGNIHLITRSVPPRIHPQLEIRHLLQQVAKSASNLDTIFSHARSFRETKPRKEYRQPHLKPISGVRIASDRGMFQLTAHTLWMFSSSTGASLKYFNHIRSLVLAFPFYPLSCFLTCGSITYPCNEY